MSKNTYLSQIVKIDDARGHQVITTGPYALIRHPMYSVVIVLLFALPIALGSRYSLILALALTALLIVRTWFEDRTLHQELEGKWQNEQVGVILIAWDVSFKAVFSVYG